MENLFIKTITVISDNRHWLGPVVLLGFTALAVREVCRNISEEIEDLFH